MLGRVMANKRALHGALGRVSCSSSAYLCLMGNTQHRCLLQSRTSSTSSTTTNAPHASQDQELTPPELVAFLDQHVIGQLQAKKAVSLAMRNRWRRRMLQGELRKEVVPMNILMCGPTGTGKTEIARRLADIGNTPFVKVLATKYTEVGFYGADCESMIVDLSRRAYEIAERQLREKNQTASKTFAEYHVLSQLRVLDPDLKVLRQLLQQGELDNHEVEIEVEIDDEESDDDSDDSSGFGGGGGSDGGNPFKKSKSPFESLLKGKGGMGIGVAAIPIDQVFGSFLGGSRDKAKRETIKKRVRVQDALEILTRREMKRRIDTRSLKAQALSDTMERGVIFIDEIDKLAMPRHEHHSMREKGEGVQKELLGLLEGALVDTPIGQVDTSHILFIAAGAFQNSSVSDLLPELQGRLPIRVVLMSLTESDYTRILKDTRHNLLEQTQALLAVEGVELRFTDDAVAAIARFATQMNIQMENIGARRLRTILAKVTEDISFEATSIANQNNNTSATITTPNTETAAAATTATNTTNMRMKAKVVIDAEFVEAKMKDVQSEVDLMKYIL